jgi:hypothetical protein
MGYVCYFCAVPQPARTVAKKIVTAYRQFQHPVRPKAIKRKVIKNGKKKTEYATDPGGFGLQIAQEVLSCPKCAEIWHRQQREMQCNLPAGQIATKVIPLAKPQLLREISPEPKRSIRQYGGPRPKKPDDFRRTYGSN